MNIVELKHRFAAGELGKPDFIRACHESHKTLFEYAQVVRTTDVKEIRIAADGVSFVMGDEQLRIYAPEGEARVAPLEVMNFDCYEPEETAVMDLLTARARCILDVGANIGWYTARWARRLPEAQIHAFEPMPVSYRYLQRNVAANGVGAQVTLYNYGLSDSAGSFEFFISPTAGTNASLKNVAGDADASAVVGLTLTMDQWVANQRVQPDFIKCDVEGAELLVFRGGHRTLSEMRPVVFTELLRKWSKPFGYHPNDVLDYFAELGYVCFAIGRNGVRRLQEVTDETLETNYAFLHAKEHADLASLLEQRS